MSETAALPRPDLFATGVAGRVLDALEAAGHEARVVGGAVRDALMGLPVDEIDVATTSPPQETARILAAAGMSVIPTGIAFGTVTAVLDKRSIEVTTLRRDVATDGRRAVVAFGTDWTADAERRDFTMNALSADRHGRVYDPVGGLDDLVARRVRFIGDARRRIAEDRLRAWRWFRFRARFGGGPVDREAFRAIAAARRDMGSLSAERVAMELSKLLSAPDAPDAVALASDAGLLIDVVGVPLLGRHRRLHATRPDADVATRLAALSVRIEDDAERVAARLKLSNAARDRMRAIAIHARSIARRPRRVLAEAEGHYAAVLAVAAADDPDGADWAALGTLPTRDPVAPMPVGGADLVAMGFAHGPDLGAVLAKLRMRYAASDYRATRDELLAASGDLR